MQKTHSPNRLLSTAALALLALGQSACSGMTQQERNTAIGAGVGAIGGSILTGGSTAGTVGGAAVGGVIGHEIDKNKK
ncbi:MAG: glycine zipper 2TM domain-containing protein [Limnohabitans sp.]|jgi:osmotically inducible lipoprotein OsmB|uniref:glycine zipper 2TM domain-containing protein n=1 Tax=Limnohabitans sp. TaxID=1907725 RepID=UPI0025EA77AE|nr:glycine zipper 2TM domain-containing protein [Limnohabitans sp.]MCO4088788.1 glycine zipper 2TM domain-containing protein [Limnohabitans sp.]